MNLSDIQLLYDYNCWANQLMLTRAADLPPQQLTQPTAFPFGTLHGTLEHILDSEYVWRTLCQKGRFTGRLIDTESFPTLGSIAAYWKKEESEMRAYLGSLHDRDLDNVIRYQTDGPLRERVLWHCLVHMVNHGTQHRSQCAAMLKDFGQPPVSIDLTLFLNERA